MKVHYLKVREKFINAISVGGKQHEFRLATNERRKIKIGDVLVLISNQNKNQYIKTTVKHIELYKDWKTALSEHWEDFQNLYNDLPSALKECYKFYSRSDVNAYGIIVYKFEVLRVNLNKSKILLDTNILIKRESSNNVSIEVAKLFKWFENKNISSYIHEVSKKELLKYGNEDTKEILLKKLNAYNILSEKNYEEDKYFNNIVSLYSQNENSQVDNMLLREVYDYNIEALLTDDKLILKKAKDLYIRDRVFNTTELLQYFEKNYPQNIDYKMLAVKLKPFNEIALENDFFDSLREIMEAKILMIGLRERVVKMNLPMFLKIKEN